MKDTYKIKLVSTVTALVLLIFAVGGTTFAWFTQNRVTTTDRVTSRTGEDYVELYVSSYGGNDFKGYRFKFKRDLFYRPCRLRYKIYGSLCCRLR